MPKGPDGWPVRGNTLPGLAGPEAFWNPDVIVWRRNVTEIVKRYEGRPLILTPCSNVKPYPRSPQSAKVRGVLRRLGLWDDKGDGYKGGPRVVGWVYLSDLLGLVPYEEAHKYPACCYNYPPEYIESDPKAWLELVFAVYSGLTAANPPVIVAYLPGRYRVILEEAVKLGLANRIVWVKYHLFYGHRYLEEALRRVLLAGF